MLNNKKLTYYLQIVTQTLPKKLYFNKNKVTNSIRNAQCRNILLHSSLAHWDIFCNRT